MYFITPVPKAIINFETESSVELEDGLLVLRPSRRTLASENVEDRFNDVIEALKADNKFYDCNEPIGHWKEKPKAKPGPKPKPRTEHKSE